MKLTDHVEAYTRMFVKDIYGRVVCERCVVMYKLPVFPLSVEFKEKGCSCLLCGDKDRNGSKVSQ